MKLFKTSKIWETLNRWKTLKIWKIILWAMVLLFLVFIAILTVQTAMINSANRASILSGVLSMIGGAAGAFGAYKVAANQMKKQFEKQDNDRVLELRINKLTETLNTANELLHKLQVWKGSISSVENTIKKKIDLGFTDLKKSDVFVQFNPDYLVEKIKEIVYFKDTLKKNYIFFLNIIDLQEIYDTTSYVAEVNKQFLSLFEDFKQNESVSVIDVKKDFDRIRLKTSQDYRLMEIAVRRLIKKLEDEINKLLKKNLY